MNSDSRSNLIRGLKNVAAKPRRQMASWLVLAVVVELALYDVISQFIQFGAIGQVQQNLLIPASWLGLDRSGMFHGSALFRISFLTIILLSIRALCISMRDHYADVTSLWIVREIRDRLFRETHRTSGTLIAPELAEETIELIERDAKAYGSSVTDSCKIRDRNLVRVIFAFVVVAIIRIDFAVILGCSFALFYLLDKAVSRARQAERVAQDQESARLRRELREELREAYQGRAIGSEMCQDRPSEDCLERLSVRDEEFAFNARKLEIARRWGQIAIVGLTLLCLTTLAASQSPTPGETLALLTLGTFAAITSLLERTAAERVGDPETVSIDRLHHALTSSARILDISNPGILQPCRNQVTIEKLPLGIHAQDPESLRELDVVLPARRVTAIVCPDAAFRSKLMRLLARWEDPSAGRILVDGVDLREFSIASTRLQIGTIRPEAYVNDGTIFDNIVLSDPRANLANVIDAAKAVHAHRMIQRLSAGYDTYIDSNKPAGEKAYLRYLIALARGKWHDPSILIVEEPAAAMTRGMKELLRDAYRRLSQDRTVILFTRHAASVLAADRVIMVGNSRVIIGEPGQLMATHKGFRRAMAEMGLGLKAKSRSKSKSKARTKAQRIVKESLAADSGKTDMNLS